MDNNNEPCPLLKDATVYKADTVDLINNTEARIYWFECLQKMIHKFIEKAETLNPQMPNASANAEKCYQHFSQLIEQLKVNPKILTPLSVRTLLEFNEKMLRENNFKDAWLMQKIQETELAFKEFPQRIKEIDRIDNDTDKWFELARGILAGNVFDWGARAVTDILENSGGNFGLKQAMEMIQPRPWFKDDLNAWVANIKKKPYKLAVIFVDNAGVDFVLGILPFSRELLKQNTKVILSANSLPALNDVTHKEVAQCLEKASQHCSIIKEALCSETLRAIENNHSGPCLDLGSLSKNLCNNIKEADLIVLEGMGRAIHTNFEAEFKVDSLKIAVLKNEWLARSLGASQFAVVFQFVPVVSLGCSC